MADPLRLQMVNYLKGCALNFKEIAGCASLEAALASRLEAPGVYFFPESEKTGSNKVASGAITQPLTETVAGLIVSKNVRDPRFADSSDENTFLRLAIREQLLGKKFEGWSPMEYSGGVMFRITNTLLIWKVAYNAQQIITGMRH